MSACALPRLGACHARPAQQPRPGHVRQPARLGRAHQGWHPARARRDGGQARGRDPRRADDRRNSPGYEAVVWYGIVAPKGTPPEIVETLNAAVNAVLADLKLEARLVQLGGVPMPMTPAQFGKLIADETEKWAKVVKFSGAKPD